MKEYFKKILNIVYVKDDTIEYIEKDSKKIAKKTYITSNPKPDIIESPLI